ncbi:zinc finger protein 684-like isoform X3 [Maniola hyperantus]
MQQVLHQFPNSTKERKRFNDWLYAVGGDIIGLENEHIYKYRRVCRRHFEEKYLCRNNKISNIAVPTLNMPGPLTLPKYTFSERKPMKLFQTNDDNIMVEPSTSTGSTAMQEIVSSNDRPLPLLQTSPKVPTAITDCQNLSSTCMKMSMHENTLQKENIDMNHKDRCRTCLSSEKEMRHVHTTITIAGDNVRLSDILHNFYNYSITEDSTLPENICINCVHQLTITYSFKMLIETSAKKLSELNLVDSTSENLEANYESDENQPHKEVSEYKTPIKQCNAKIENDITFCVECKSEFQSVKQLKEHCAKRHPIKSTIGRDCDYCNEKFDDFRSLVLHRKLHLKPFLCENCWEGFYSLYELNTHSCQPNKNKIKNNTAERELRQCDQCGKSYPPGYIKIHMRTHSSDRPYRCKFCPKAFKVPGSLHSHVLWNHKRTRNHKCEVCNATFISSSSRSSHIRKNHLKEKKYGCESCSKRFFSKSELQRHSLTHTGVKNFHCHLCDKSYQTRYGLNVHLKSHTQMQMKIEHELVNYVNI